MPSRRVGVLVVSLLVGALVCGTTAAGRPEAAPRKQVWEGYVWKDKQGRLQLGVGVIAMGVMARPDYVIAGPLAERLAPHAVATSEYVFWNYSLERPEAEMLSGLPRVLVRLEGLVTEGDDPSGPGSFPRMAPLTMVDARLASIEFVSDAWLKDWAFFFRTPDSPFRVAQRPEADAQAAARFAGQALDALKRLRAHPGPSEAQRAEAKAIDANARVGDHFRQDHQDDIQRWLAAENTAKGWSLAGLDTLPALPPASTVIQSWFLAAETKVEFLAAAAKAWTGDLTRLVLVHYVHTPATGSTSYATADLREVMDHWTQEEYARYRATTKEMGAR